MTREQAKEHADNILRSLCSGEGCCVSNVDTIAQALITAHNDAIEAAYQVAICDEACDRCTGEYTCARRAIEALKIGAPE